MEAARAFIQDYYVAPRVVWYCDTISNAFNEKYASWPFRFWVLEPSKNGVPHTVGFKAMPKNAMYDLSDLGVYLMDRQSGSSGSD